jgi:hypothetical protein
MTCRLCERLAAGFTLSKFGADISPFCAACSGDKTHIHHFGACKTEPVKGVCPRCGGRCAVVDIPQSGRWEKQIYGRWCHECYLAEGYELVMDTVYLKTGPKRVSWYEKPPEPDPITTDELVAMAGAKDYHAAGHVAQRRL